MNHCLRGISILKFGRNLIISAGFLVIASVVHADNSAIKQQIQAEYMKSFAALKAKDIKGLMLRYTLDFTCRFGPKNIMTRAQVEDSADFQMIATKEIKELTFAITDVTVKGNTAIVNVKQKETIIMVLRKVEHKVTSSQISSDTWIKTPSGWRVKFQDIKSNITTEDGKVVTTVK